MLDYILLLTATFTPFEVSHLSVPQAPPLSPREPLRSDQLVPLHMGQQGGALRQANCSQTNKQTNKQSFVMIQHRRPYGVVRQEGRLRGLTQ